MKNLCLTVLLTALTSSAVLAACSDDPAGTNPSSSGAGGADGNEAGTPSGGKATGGKATGGSNTNAGNGGSNAGEPGVAGAGGEMTGEGGEPAVVGGAGGEAAGGAAGAGGAGSEVVYLCNDATQSHKLCSAFKAAACVPATDCADCVTTRNLEHEPFEECAACEAEYDAFEQCGIDALESGNLASGVECVEDWGADLHFENCSAMFNSANLCLDYIFDNPCPASWPIE